MKIHSLANIIGFPFILAFAALLYICSDYKHQDLSFWLLPLGVILAVVYIFKPQIDFWWYSRHPSRLDKRIISWLTQYSYFYQGLNAVERRKFEDRLSIFIRAKSFKTMKGHDKLEMPEDLKAIVASNAIMLTFYDEDFLFEKFEYYIMYKHPYPSPKYPYLHNEEINEEDGVMIWSMGAFIPGMIDKDEYNIGLHSFVKSQKYLLGDAAFDEIGNELLQLKTRKTDIPIDKIRKAIGREEIDLQVVDRVLRYG